MNIKYKFYKMLSIFFGAKYLMKYYRKQGMHIGNDTNIFSKIITSEPYLISIGNHSTIATNVTLITHDASIGALNDRNQASDLCGRIIIGDNCFIGSGAIIMYGVTIPANTIVAAGSVVCKSPEKGGVIIGGNPAKIIGETELFKNKNYLKSFSLHGISLEDRKQKILEEPEKLVKR